MLFLAFGILIGFFFRKKEKFLLYVDRVTALAIYMLLFFLGISVGINEKVMNNILTLGLKSLLLSSGAIVGSVVFSYLIEICFFRRFAK